MAPRIPAGFVLLTQAQRIFAFRSLKQLTAYLERHGDNVRQKPNGRRRYICVVDLADAILLRDPRKIVVAKSERRTQRAERQSTNCTSCLRLRYKKDEDQIENLKGRNNELQRRCDDEWNTAQKLREFIARHGLLSEWQEELREAQWGTNSYQ